MKNRMERVLLLAIQLEKEVDNISAIFGNKKIEVCFEQLIHIFFYQILERFLNQGFL